MNALKKTPLYAQHQTLNAKMTNFGGWEMPIHYGSQMDEHHSVRHHAGMFDVSHMCVIDFVGSNALHFLEYALANNIRKLVTKGKALYTCMLNEEGGVIDDLIIYYLSDHHYRAIVNAGTSEKDILWLNTLKQNIHSNVNILVRRDLAILAVQGPLARQKCWQAFPEIQFDTESLKPFHSIQLNTVALGEIMVARTGYTGEDGFELIMSEKAIVFAWQALLKQGVRPCGLGARDTLRLEAGMHLYGQDMNEQTLPTNVGLGWTIDLSSDRPFVGRKALEAHQPASKLVGLILEKENGKAAGVLRAQQTIITQQGKGIVSSGSFSPTLQESIALARVPIPTKIDDIVHVQIRQKSLPAKVVSLPFVRHGKILHHAQKQPILSI